MHLTKHHGLGNDFLVLLDLDDRRPLDALDARALCDRHTGIGADGLIRVSPGDAAGGAEVTMALRNADGSVAEMSGNGIRCLGQAVARSRGVEHLDLLVATLGGDRRVVVGPGPDAATALVEVDMGPVRPVRLPPLAWDGFAPQAVELVDVGNPHVVALAGTPAEVAELDLATLGPAIEAAVPGGVNLEVIAVADDRPDTLELRVWERGAGLTLACGTGAAAAAAVARRWGLVGRRVVVRMPGGEVEVGVPAPADGEADGADESVTLRGPAVHVADIEVPWR